MANPKEGPLPAASPWRPRLNFSLRVWMILVAVVGVTIGLQYRRELIRPSTVPNLSPVARLPKADIFQIAWSRDRDRMAVIGWEKPVEVRDPVSLGLLETIGEGKKIIHFAFSPDADVVAYSENDRSGTAKILHRASGKVVALDAGSEQPRIVFNQDGSLLATGGSAMVRLWSVGDGHLVREFDVGADGGLRPQFSPDGRLLAVGNRNSSTVLFETSTGRR
jgi:WD40 repeat protein